MATDEDTPYARMLRPQDRSLNLDERRRAALAEIDEAGFSWFHVKVCAVAGVGFFTDAYDLFAINIASAMLAYVYPSVNQHNPLALNRAQDLGVKIAAPVGTIFGQLVFGWLADDLGRKRMYGIELMIIIFSTFAQALSGGYRAVNIFGVLVVWRFLMGIGIGGDYPLSAVISSEFASTNIRGSMMTAVFSHQGLGQFTGSLVSIIIVAASRDAVINSPDTTSAQNHVDAMWRLLIGLGCIPGVIALFFRLTIPETPRFTMDIERNVDQAANDIADILRHRRPASLDEDAPVHRGKARKSSLRDFIDYFSKWENRKILIGTAYSWFANDIAVYGLGLNTSIILQGIGFATQDMGDSSQVLDLAIPHANRMLAGNAVGITVRAPQISTREVYNDLLNISVGNLILSLAGLIPGYIASFFLIDTWGRKPIQLLGFTAVAILSLIMGSAYKQLTVMPASCTTSGEASGSTQALKAFVFLYCLVNFFLNFGPNTTTFVIPGEVFPTRYRSTCHGISAASGKLGAVLAQIAFSLMKDIGGPRDCDAFLGHILQILAFFMATGILSTLLLPETKGLSLETLSNENQHGFMQDPIELAPRQRRRRPTTVTLHFDDEDIAYIPVDTEEPPL